MTIQAGDRLPSGTFKTMTKDGLKDVDAHSFFAHRRVVFFGVPGAFTPGCTRNHLPDYVSQAEKILAKGYDAIACMAVNDAWVMEAWGRGAGADGKVTMLADGSAVYAHALGLNDDLTGAGMGIRCKRFSMIVDDGVVESINIDARYIEFTSAQYTCGL